MIFLFIVTLIITILGMNCFLTLIEKEKILVRPEGINTIVKPCIRELHKKKKNTPIMGGIVMNVLLLVFTIGYLIWRKEVIWYNLVAGLFGAIGIIDDYIKIKKPQDGLTLKKKLGMTLLVSILVSVILTGNGVNIIESKFIGIMIITLIITGSVNSFNLTDGLDGLLLGMSIIMFSFIGTIAFYKSNDEILLSVIVILACCIGTLLFNKNPAKVFIGDTGSFFLGALASIYLIVLEMPIYIFLVGIVCFFESFSVMIQLASLKFRQKKIFLIAPYHHHLEKKGIKENRITMIFYLVTLIACISALIITKGEIL